MTESKIPRWLQLAREIQAIAQTGLTFSANGYDLQRYHRLMELAAEIAEQYMSLPEEPWLQSFLAHPGYATPKVDVRAAIMRDGKILLVQERADERYHRERKQSYRSARTARAACRSARGSHDACHVETASSRGHWAG